MLKIAFCGWPPRGHNRHITKILLVMKLTIVLLTITLLHVSAKSLSQTVNFSGNNVPLEKIIPVIENQTGFAFVYTDAVIKGAVPVTINASNEPLEQFLSELFKNGNIRFEINNKSILLSRKSATAPPSDAQQWTTPGFAHDTLFPVQGRVMDEEGNALPGATVVIKGIQVGASSNADGVFQFKNIPQGKYKLEVTFIGYEKSVTTLSLYSQSAQIMVMLKHSSSKLDETVIKGYYTTTNRLNTGSVATVKAEAIERQIVNDPILALEGLVPGLYIQQSSGMPGAPVNVQLRGVNSIQAGTLPLYIIDGVPFNGDRVDRQNIGGGYETGGLPNGGSDPMNLINPMDIESIDVLKDADATAIYGSRGANGVILITTKRGKAGKTNFSVNGFSGAGKVSKLLPTLNTAEYLAIRRKAFANDGITPTIDNAPDLVQWSPTDNVNYEKMLIGGTSHINEINASASGGDQFTTFLLGGTFHRETPVMPGSSHYQRGAVNMKADHVSIDGKFRIGFSTIYSTDNNLIYGPDFTNTSVTYPNNYPLYQDGKTYWGGGFSNPLGLLRQNLKTNTENQILNATASYNILSNLQFKVSAGQSKIDLEQKLLYPGSSYNPAYQNTGVGFYSGNTTKSYILEPQLNYHTMISKGKLDAIAGGTWQSTQFDQPFYVVATGFASDALIDNYGSAGTVFVNKNTNAEYKYASVFGRVNYAWQNKYILNGTFRRDGSSRFGPDKRFGNFGSVGAAWIFSDEPMFKSLRWLSYGKLRGSYGTVGNDQIPNYAYLSTYSSTFAPYGTAPGYVPTGVANPNYSWERTNKLEGALELSFLNSRLQFTGAWFRNRSDNLLAQYPLAPQSGFSSYTANLQALVQNKGVEIEIKGTPVDTKNFTWNVSFNISAYKNELLSFPDLLTSTYANKYIVGQPLSIIGAYHLTGFKDGQATVQDEDKDGAITPGLHANGKGDFVNAGSRDPKYFGGFVNSFHYKQFQLDVLFNFVGQKNYAITSFPGLMNNQYRDVLNSQFTPSTLSSSASYNSYVNYYTFSDATLTDASFIRLKNISLSYSLPERWRKAVKMVNCRVYVRGQNLLTLTKYKGFDPETTINPGILGNPYAPATSTPSLPTLKMITGGLQFSF